LLRLAQSIRDRTIRRVKDIFIMPGIRAPGSSGLVDGSPEQFTIHTARPEFSEHNAGNADMEAPPLAQLGISAAAAMAAHDTAVLKGLSKCYGSIDTVPTISVPATTIAPAPVSTLTRAIIVVTLAATYIAISASMICFNKFLMTADRFPFAAQLTTIHMITSWVLASALRAFIPAFFPSASTVFGENGDAEKDKVFLIVQFHRFKPFIPIACCGAVSLVAGNTAYQYASVAFLQMVKESHIVFVYGLMVFYGLDRLRLRNVMVIIFVAVMASLAVYGELHFSATGLSLQMCAGFAGSLQIVLSNKLMAQSKGPKIDPMTMVLCIAPVTLCVMLPVNVGFWNPVIPERAVVWWRFLVLNALLAFALQVVTAIAIRELSGTGQALASVLKDLCIIGAASLILHENLAMLQYIGFAGAVSGMFLYSIMKLCPHWFETPVPSVAEPSPGGAIVK